MKWQLLGFRKTSGLEGMHGQLLLATPGRPGEDKVTKRNKGVGIMINQFATAAWKEVREKWEAINSQI